MILTDPYKSKLAGINTLLNELVTFGFYLFLLFPFISNFRLSKHRTTFDCIYIVLTALIINAAFAVLLGMNKVLEWLKNRRLAISKLNTITNEVTGLGRQEQSSEIRKI